jgi:signal transduction histidine kinase
MCLQVRDIKLTELEQIQIKMAKMMALGEIIFYAVDEVLNRHRYMDFSLGELEGANPEMRREIVKELKGSLALCTEFMTHIKAFRAVSQDECRFNVEELIDSVLGMVRILVDQKKINLIIEANRTEISGYRDVFTIIMISLVMNAIEAVDEGGTIEIDAKRDNEIVIFHVSDDGRGLDPNLQDLVFDTNYSTKEYGTGVGLFLAKKELAKIGGHISFRPNSAGKGTTFVVVIPCR